VIVAVPTPTTVTVEPFTVATAVLLDVYVIAPLLLDVGAVRLNAAAPKVFAIAAMLPIVGLVFSTESTTVAVTEPDAFVAVIVYVVSDEAAVGVPAMIPVLVLKLKPVGKLGVIA
jgi:hypothetical protein